MRSRRVLSLSLQVAAAGFFALILVVVSNPALGQATVAPKNVTINMQNTKFDPAMASAEVNATVSWVNKDSFGHDVIVRNSDINSGAAGGIQSGQKFERKFDKPGLYEYYCRAHSPQGFGGSGMFGRLVVMSAPFSPIGAAGAEANPEHIGVRWLAHWVGIISFIAVFAVLIVYYFVLKYGETVHATDHRERKEK